LKDIVVILTGSTGHLSVQILDALLCDSRVDRIYAMNRASKNSQSIVERQIERFKDKGFDVDMLSSKKLVYLEGDMTKDDLGCSRAELPTMSVHRRECAFSPLEDTLPNLLL
jgi:thioester reductase-like protein